MVRYNVGRYIAVIAFLSVAIFLAISLIRNNLSFENIGVVWENFTTMLTMLIAICTLFVLWAWKLNIFQNWLVPFPCLSGEWSGEINSTYSYERKSIPIEVFVKHNFFNVQIKITTKESVSLSTCTSFDIDSDRGLKQLIYSYQNNPKATVRERSEIHYGTARLEINNDAKILEGEYWTSRKTTGDMILKKASKSDGS